MYFEMDNSEDKMSETIIKTRRDMSVNIHQMYHLMHQIEIMFGLLSNLLIASIW